jgi:carbonic anhydrase
MQSFEKLLLANKAWSKEKTDLRTNYFTELAKDQTPEFLWIGCSDSRVPAEEITGASPGEIFVHRNVANLVVPTDLNLLSVLQYAVDYLKIKHVIVCGHYGCGGVRAALTKQRYGLLNKWLRQLKDIYVTHQKDIDQASSHADRLVEISVGEQVANLAKTSIIQNAWRNRNGPTLHGWVFDIKTGELKSLVEMTASAAIPEIFRFEFADDLGDSND